MGPFAHLDFERKLLESAQSLANAATDQDYPEWIVSSVPGTPDRTGHQLGENDDPTPWLIRSLRRLALGTPEAPAAHFAVMVCNTAHLYLETLRRRASIPIVDMVGLTATTIAQRRPGIRVGIMATTGTLQNGLYAHALRDANLDAVTLLDLPGGEALQEELVMAAIYGPREAGGKRGGPSIKGQGYTESFRDMITAAAEILVQRGGAEALIAGCTEIPIVLTGDTAAGVPLFDPTKLLADEAIRLAYRLDGAMTDLPGAEAPLRQP